MKIKNEPVSAFSVYSENLKQKKKPKVIKNKTVQKTTLKKNKQNAILMKNLLKKEDIDSILKELSDEAVYELSKNTSQVVTNVEVNRHKNNLKNVSQNKVVLAPITIKGKKESTKNNLNTKNKKNPIVNSQKSKGFSNRQPVHNLSLERKNTIQTRIKNNINGSKHTISGSNGVEIEKVTNKNTRKNRKRQNANKLLTPVVKNKDRIWYAFLNNIQNDHSNNSKETEVTNSNNVGNGNSIAVKNKINKNRSKKKKANSHNIDVNSSFIEDSIKTGKHTFEWLILPIKEHDFMLNYWEKQPLLVRRDGHPHYFSELLSTPTIDTMLRENIVYFTKNLDVTSYRNGVRKTHNLTGRAQANLVWDYYSNGCSVRLLNPQAFLPKLHALNSTLQEYFGCFVGANVYLTPPNSQGFAPHYDDIEAFVLQIEGKKHWKVYPPRSDKETLPRFSSPNFSQEEIGQPFLNVVLEPGDMLYFPRGYIHQASTVKGEHSLHITLSAYQKTAWVDLLEKALPIALKRAATEDVEFRTGLPRNYLNLEHHGSNRDKAAFLDTAQRLMNKLGHFLSVSLGAGVDQMGAQFMHDALPPVFTEGDTLNSGLGGGFKMKEMGKLTGRGEFQLDTKVKLIRANICRLVEEESEVRLYHCLDNPLEYHAEDPQFLVLPSEDIQVITFLSRKYPSFVPIKHIPRVSDDALLALISDLWDAGLLVTDSL